MKKNIIEEQSINDNNYKKLKELFPHAVSVDEDGKYTIDPQKLQMSLDPSLANIREDGYGLNWVGKKEAYHTAFSKNYKVLKPLNDEANSKEWETTDNILIKGDNLDALKILRHNYFESIKMIYIDPPYNTKNDGFVYNDNFTSSTEQTLEELGYDKEYIDYIENIQGAKTHSGWLSFMYPRLLLSRDLLKDDGVIFISIDNNEVAQLRLLCDEVFGEESFLAEFIWKKRSGTNDAKNLVSSDHEYILCYGKNQDILLNGKEKTFENYKNPDNDPLGAWTSGDLTCNKTATERPNLYYPIIDPETNITYQCNKNRVWAYEQSRMQKNIDEKKIIFPKDGKGSPMYKRHKNEVKSDTKPLSSLLGDFLNATSTKELRELLDGQYFDYPKNIQLLKTLVTQATNQNDIILDFFAGSGTTAHAVMDLNAKDGGNRKFICVQWAEETPEKSEARKAGYETIFDITRERIKRAGEKILNQVQNDGGGVRNDGGVDEILNQVQNDGAGVRNDGAGVRNDGGGVRNDGGGVQNDGGLDVGFRTFEVVEDVKQKIYQKSLEEMTQEDLLSFMSKPNIENNEEILYNLFVAENLPLSVKYETLIENKLFLAHNVAFVLGDINSDALVEALREKKACEYITVYSPAISDDKFTLEIESNISKLGIKPDKLRFRG
ncbi:MAG: site-specific DNA-methyltransferase [Sulfurimonas sp.]|nr:site-specific DNA-methyltransferase [Sulfurimonas sp.]